MEREEQVGEGQLRGGEPACALLLCVGCKQTRQLQSRATIIAVLNAWDTAPLVPPNPLPCFRHHCRKFKQVEDPVHLGHHPKQSQAVGWGSALSLPENLVLEGRSPAEGAEGSGRNSNDLEFAFGPRHSRWFLLGMLKMKERTLRERPRWHVAVALLHRDCHTSLRCASRC